MANISTVKATINGQVYDLTYNSTTQAYEASLTAPSTSSWNQTDHVYGISITATDEAGNTVTVNPTSTEFGTELKLRVLEQVKPTVVITNPTDSATIGNSKPTITVNVTDAGSGVDISTFKLKIDNGSEIGISSCTYSAITNGYAVSYTPTTAISDAQHTVQAYVSDNDGNVADTVSSTFTVNTVAPNLSLTDFADNIVTNETSFTVAGTTNAYGTSDVTITIKVNGSDPVEATVSSVDGSFSKAITLSEGTNTVIIKATDALGKETTITRTITVDTTPPTFTSVTVSPNPANTGQTYIISVKLSV